MSRSNRLKVDVRNGGRSEDLDGKASRSTLEGTKAGGACVKHGDVVLEQEVDFGLLFGRK